MSHRWGVFCLDCQDDMGICVNRAVDAMRAVCKLGPAFARVGVEEIAAAERAGLDVTIGYFNDTARLGWLAKHGAHRIVPRDEYGRDDTQCEQDFRCSGGHWHPCKLERAHDGEHGPNATTEAGQVPAEGSTK